MALARVVLLGVKLPLVVALFVPVAFQVVLFMMQLAIRLVQARAVALQRVLVPLQLGEIRFKLRRVFRRHVVMDSLAVALHALFGPGNRLTIGMDGLMRLIDRGLIVADILPLVLNVLLQSGRACVAAGS